MNLNLPTRLLQLIGKSDNNSAMINVPNQSGLPTRLIEPNVFNSMNTVRLQKQTKTEKIIKNVDGSVTIERSVITSTRTETTSFFDNFWEH